MLTVDELDERLPIKDLWGASNLAGKRWPGRRTYVRMDGIVCVIGIPKDHSRTVEYRALTWRGAFALADEMEGKQK